MADYISREAAVKVLTSIGVQVSDSRRRAVAKCINEIELLPAADVEQVRHGHWTRKKDNDGFPYFEHEECGKKYRRIGGLQYCQNCGAKMDGGE